MSQSAHAFGFPATRLRRFRRSEGLRTLVRETRLEPAHLVQPYFVVPGEGVREPIPTMPGQARVSVDVLVKEAREAAGLGLGGIILFGLPVAKDDQGSSGWDSAGPVPSAIRAVKAEVPELPILADVCCCEYTSHGHCGVVTGGEVDNDATLPLLARMALAYAEAGADVVAPSDMMDGRVGFLRSALDGAGFSRVAILSYAIKHASAFYGPFRDAAGSTPAFGDRRGYQMDPANAREAMREADLDVFEGADALMVKPAITCLDLIQRLRQRHDLPIAAYQVSGEYAMIKAAAGHGMIDEGRAMAETLTAIRRAGADFILSYFARDMAKKLEAI